MTVTLGITAYGRYVDDFYIIVRKSELAAFRREKLPLIEEFVLGLKLTLHPKKRYCQPIEKGVPFLGARLYKWHIIPDRRAARNFHQIVQEVAAGERGLASLKACLGRFQHLDAQKMIQREWTRNSWNYQFSLGVNWSEWYGV